MITGAIILLAGIGLGYSIPFWRMPTFDSPIQRRINKIIRSNNAKIVELNEEIDLGETKL